MNNLSKMNKLINELSDAPFKYGTNDCYSFTAKLAKEWHGIDHVKLHAVYKNQKEAEEYIAMHGGIESLITGTIGYGCDPMKCRDGDVVTAEFPSGIALGFVFNGYGLFKSKKTVLKLPLNKCSKGWRVKA